MEIKFKRDTTFRKQFFVPDSFAHPAKMDAQLLIWIVEKYTSEGETILDPMSGMGTMMLACTLGRNVVLGELEEKFCKMMRDNWAEVRMRPQLGSKMGNCQIIQGDARNLRGLFDKCVFSPPYVGVLANQDAEMVTRRKATTKRNKKTGAHPQWNSPEALARTASGYPDNPSNIGNLPYGQIDKIVTSPPYQKDAELHGESHEKGREDGCRPRNPFVDAVVTSPPYEGSNTTGIPDTYNGSHGPYSQVQLSDYRQSKDNIGNLKSTSYLEAMLQVYQQCHSVLKDGGLMILVTKNFIRNKAVIRLDTDTIKLCEQAGFTYLERHYRKLPSQSFWRVIYAQKHPEVEKLEHEDVLVFKKVET